MSVDKFNSEGYYDPTLAFFHTSARFHSFRESAQIQKKFRASPLLEEKPGLFMVSTLIIDTSSKKALFYRGL